MTNTQQASRMRGTAAEQRPIRVSTLHRPVLIDTRTGLYKKQASDGVGADAGLGAAAHRDHSAR